MGYYLVNVGPNAKNAGGVGARGYWIRRTGRTVRRTWGPVDVEGSRGAKVFWRGTPREQCDDFGSVQEAAEFVERKLREKLEHAAGGYRRLPPPNRIR